MKVLWDHQCFSMQQYGGISRHFVSIHQHLTSGVEIEIPLFVGENEYVPKRYKQLRIPLPPIKGKVLSKRLLNNQLSAKHIKKGDYSVFHATYYDPYFVKYIQKPYVITIHDMIHELRPDLLPKRDQKITRWKKAISEKASGIICVSSTVKDKLLQVYPTIDAKKVHVIYHDTDMVASNGNEFDFNYILYVGIRTHYKNFNATIRAFKEVSKNHTDLRLICAGGGKFTKAELKEIKELELDGLVVQVNITDETLANLYSKAVLFIFPSKAEGFGIPLIEAFQMKCPVACSNLAVFKEVCVDAAIFFDPDNVADIANSMNEVLNSNSLRNTLISSGSQRRAMFSWKESAEKLAKVYESLIK